MPEITIPIEVFKQDFPQKMPKNCIKCGQNTNDKKQYRIHRNTDETYRASYGGKITHVVIRYDFGDISLPYCKNCYDQINIQNKQKEQKAKKASLILGIPSVLLGVSFLLTYIINSPPYSEMNPAPIYIPIMFLGSIIGLFVAAYCFLYTTPYEEKPDYFKHDATFINFNVISYITLSPLSEEFVNNCIINLNQTKQIYVKENTNIYQKTNKKSFIIKTLQQEDDLQLIRIIYSWAVVCLNDKTIGYCFNLKYFQLLKDAAEGDMEGVILCLKKGCNVNEKDANGNTALIFAVNEGDLKMTKLLIDANADVNVKTNNGSIALMIAALKGYSGIVKLLIDANADINAKSKEGETALMYAVGKNYIEVVKLLINANVDINAKSNNGCTALRYANNNEIKTLLKKVGAK